MVYFEAHFIYPRGSLSYGRVAIRAVKHDFTSLGLIRQSIRLLYATKRSISSATISSSVIGLTELLTDA